MTLPARSQRAIVSLTTDFGTRDSYVGQMKGVMLGIDARLHLIDVTHDIPAQDVLEGAFQLATFWRFFPEGSVHLVVVDPGVGGARRPIAFMHRGRVFVGPDNGLGTLVLGNEPPERAVVLDHQDQYRSTISATFHGRDIFAPAAGLIASGVDLAQIGSPIDVASLVRLPVRPIEQRAGTTIGPVASIDHFGNCRTLINREHLPGSPDQVEVVCGPLRLPGIARTFADVESGASLAYFGSHGGLEIAVNGGDASQQWGISRDDSVVVQLRQ